MKDTFKIQNEKTMWYENDEPVREYLDSAFSRKSHGTDKDSKPVTFSWLEMIKNSFHIK
jgi:hypothetical protein